MNKHQEHLDKCIRESLPHALDHIGMHEVASTFRNLPELANFYRIEKAGKMLRSVLPELKEATGLPDIIQAGASPAMVKEAEKYRSGIAVACDLVACCSQATQQALHGGIVLN